MITEVVFNEMVEKARKCTYSSMNYLEYKDCKHSEIIEYDDSLILVLDESGVRSVLHFATQDFEGVLQCIRTIKKAIKLNFVTKVYAAALKDLGFIEWGEYQGFFNHNINKTRNNFENEVPIEFLKPGQAELVISVVNNCMLQSRGFAGFPPSFYKDMAEDGKIIISRKNDEIIGFCVVDIYDSGVQTLHIKEIAVNPAHQGQGFAKKLLNQSFEWGIKQSATKTFLMADILNVHAISLYKKYHFEPDGDDTELQMIRT